MIRQKPPAIARIGRAAAARYGVTWLALFQGEKLARDLIGGLDVTSHVNSAVIDTDEGSALASGGGSLLTTVPFLDGVPFERFALVARIRCTATSGENTHAAISISSSAGGGSLGIGANTASTRMGVSFASGSGTNIIATADVPLGDWATVIAQGGPIARAWINGKPANFSQGATISLIGTPSRIVLGAQGPAGTLRVFKGDILWASILVNDAADWMTDALAADIYSSDFPYNLQASSRSLWAAAGSGPEPVAPPLLTNSQALYLPAVGRGAVALSTPLLSSAGLVYPATVGRGSIALSPPLLSNTQTLYAPVVTSVSAALRPPLLTNTSTAYVPDVTRGAVAITAPLMASSGQMFAPAVGAGGSAVAVPLLVNASVVHAPTVQAGAVALAAPLLVSAGAAYAPSVSAGALQLIPPLLANSQIFYAPSVGEPGPRTVGLRRQVSMPRLLRTVEMQPLNRRVGP